MILSLYYKYRKALRLVAFGALIVSLFLYFFSGKKDQTAYYETICRGLPPLIYDNCIESLKQRRLVIFKNLTD